MSASAAANQPVLVSLHMAKTAGTSFAEALRAHFGHALLENYAVLPTNRRRGLREWDAIRNGLCERLPAGVRAVHGHFLPLQYALALRGQPVDFVTWLRDPVERLLSHYHFWRRTAQRATPAQPLRYRVVHEDWSLERFCLGPELRNYYRQHLWGFAPSRFAFVGITERYASDLARFADRFLGGVAPVAHARGNPDRDPEGYRLPSALRARIEAHHAWDTALYRRVRDASG